MATPSERAPGRERFQFTSPQMQRGEAHQNVREALAFLQRFAPKQPPAEVLVKTTAGSCFRRVSALLDGKGKP